MKGEKKKRKKEKEKKKKSDWNVYNLKIFRWKIAVGAKLGINVNVWRTGRSIGSMDYCDALTSNKINQMVIQLIVHCKL